MKTVSPHKGWKAFQARSAVKGVSWISRRPKLKQDQEIRPAGARLPFSSRERFNWVLPPSAENGALLCDNSFLILDKRFRWVGLRNTSWNNIKKYDQPAPFSSLARFNWVLSLSAENGALLCDDSFLTLKMRPWAKSSSAWQLVLFVRNWFNRLSLHTACQSWLGHVLSRTALSPSSPTLS